LLFHDGQPLDERCPTQSDSRQGQNATTRPFSEANAYCAEQLHRKYFNRPLRSWRRDRQEGI